MARKFYKYDPDTQSVIAEEAQSEPTINVPWMKEPTTYAEIDLPTFSKNKIPKFNANNPLVKTLDTLVGSLKSTFGLDPSKEIDTQSILPRLVEAISGFKDFIQPSAGIPPVQAPVQVPVQAPVQAPVQGPVQGPVQAPYTRPPVLPITGQEDIDIEEIPTSQDVDLGFVNPFIEPTTPPVGPVDPPIEPVKLESIHKDFANKWPARVEGEQYIDEGLSNVPNSQEKTFYQKEMNGLNFILTKL